MKKHPAFTHFIFHGALQLSCAIVLLFLLGACKSGHGRSDKVSGYIALPKTGQLSCTDDSGAVIACVTTGQDSDLRAGVALPVPRFFPGRSGNCVADHLTGLIWVRNPDAIARTRQPALDFARNLSLCGANNWRLPNVKELENLVNLEAVNQDTFLDGEGFSGVQSSGYGPPTIYSG